MLDQTEDYIGKALVAETKGDDTFLTESELAFRVTGEMYKNKVKSDGPVSLRAIRGKMPRVRTMCDLKGMLLLPRVEDVEVEGKPEPQVTGWKIATPNDITYLGEVYFGVKHDDAEEAHAESPEAKAEAEKD